MESTFAITANVVDLAERRIYPATVHVAAGKIASIVPEPTIQPLTYLIPGLVDAHVHIESSMLVPTEFARAAVVHGTVATVSDPHEIGNVLGVDGVRYMLDNAAQTPFKFFFGAPSCVPATTFETSGAQITVDEVATLLDDPRVLYLSEMMNYPGVLNGDPSCLAKIKAAQDRGKPVDGHAPGLRGEQAQKYVAAGMTTDHECFTLGEALDKLKAGCKISIREGSAARNFDALVSLLRDHPDQAMLCSDDKHPDELLDGHINQLVSRAIAAGANVFDALHAACVVPAQHYGLPIGLLREEDPADFVEVGSLSRFEVLRTWIDGELVAENGDTLLPRVEPEVLNRFVAQEVAPEQLKIEASGSDVTVICAEDGQLVTGRKTCPPLVVDGQITADLGDDVLKLVVVNRYQTASPAIALIHGFGLERGAIASSVAHDSHNVIAVGTSDEEIAEAINLVMRAQGGLSAVSQDDEIAEIQTLPVAGLMATGTCREVGVAYARLDQLVKEFGSPLRAPYMTLSFMALLVIPSLKLSDQGLFDGERFAFTPLESGSDVSRDQP